MVSVLTDSVDGRKYWNKLKQRLKAEGSELVTNCHQLKLPSADGKYYKTDVATTEQLFRLIQSIPSPKAEPFKLWMAQVAKERLDEMQDPELTIDWAMREYSFKGLKKENLRDNMTNTELALNMLAEAATTELSKEKDPQHFEEHARIAQQGGKAAEAARRQLESDLEHSMISPLNAKSGLRLEKGESEE